jgi:phosphoesterase RecJ-like protein
LRELKVEEGGELAWMVITKDMYKKSGAVSDESHGFIDYARDLIGVKVAALFEEQSDGKIRVSLRSRDNRIDVDHIASKYGGGGHSAAAGLTVSGNLDDVERLILEVLKNAIRRCR